MSPKRCQCPALHPWGREVRWGAGLLGGPHCIPRCCPRLPASAADFGRDGVEERFRTPPGGSSGEWSRPADFWVLRPALESPRPRGYAIVRKPCLIGGRGVEPGLAPRAPSLMASVTSLFSLPWNSGSTQLHSLRSAVVFVGPVPSLQHKPSALCSISLCPQGPHSSGR